MKTDCRALSGALGELVRVADQRASVPILSHVMLRAAAGVLTLRATDLSRNLTCQLPAEGDLVTCLPAKLLAALVKPEGRSDAGDVVIEPEGETSCTVTLDGLTSRVHAMSPEEFPAGLAADDTQWSLLALWPAVAIGEALRFVLPAASPDEGRPHLNGVCLDLGRIAATDGHRVHVAELPGQIPEPMLIPLQAAVTLDRILKLDDQVILARADDVLRMRVGAWELETRLVDARFPPVDKVIPGDRPVTMSLDSALLLKALSRVSRLSRERLIRVTVNGQITITTTDPDLGTAEVVVPVLDTSHEGDDLVLGFNSTYLSDALGSSRDVVRFGMAGPTDAVRLDLDEGRFAVIMPMRL